MKRKTMASKYIHVATNKPILFYSFLALGVAMFLYLTMTTRIETKDGAKTLFWMIFMRAGRGL